MTSKTRKRILRWTLIPIFLLILLVGIAAGILYTQQERLVRLAVTELNKKLPGELVVGGSDLSLVQNFPYISIGLKNVKLLPTKISGVTPIYEAERMFVGFSIKDILNQQYHVKVILLKNGHLDLVQDSTGQLNLVEAVAIAPDTTAKAAPGSQPLDLDIKKFVLKNMRITYRDPKSGQRIEADIPRIQTALRDDGSKIAAESKGSFVLDFFRPGDTTLFRHKHIETDINLSFDEKKKFLRLPLGKLKLEDAAFNITGTVDLLHDPVVDLRIKGDKPDFRQLFAFAPASVAKELKHFKYDGELSFDGTVKGAIKAGQQPLIALNFACKNAWLHNTEAKKKLDSLSFKGFYTNGADRSLKTSELRLMDMSARPEKGIFKGNFVMRDFTDPKIFMQIRSELELGFIGAFLGIKDLERLSGHVDLKMNFKELVDLTDDKTMSQLTEGIQSELKVTNLTFRVPNYPYLIEHLNLHAAMKNGFVDLDTLSCNVGNSDLHLEGSLTDLPALFHHQEKPVVLKLHANSNKLVLRELFNADTTKNRKAREEIYGFNIGLTLETSVKELQHPNPLPKGKFSIAGLSAAFKNYPHAFKNFGADLTIGDTSVLLRNFAGSIDSSDIQFRGRVNNYALWFGKVKKGKTLLAFDLKSQRLAMRDLLGRKSRQFVPQDYRQEVGSNIWLRSKTELRYDSVFKFANIHIANISGMLQKHHYRLDSVNGNIKFADNFIKLDTFRGKIGNTDFNCSMRLYTGKDTLRRKKENFLQFSSRLLDVDQLSNYVATAGQDAPETTATPDTAAAPMATTVAAKSTPAAHNAGFNLFSVPFIDFNARINIGRIRYHRIGIKNLSTSGRMLATQQIYLDTFYAEMAGGRMTANAHFDGANAQKITLDSKLSVEDMNIEKLMLKLDNFGEDIMINKNIKGIISGQIRSTLLIHPDLTPIVDQSTAQMDLEILNGVLINFAPMKAMASYFTDKNLMMVRFDTLRNTLAFRNGAVIIPDMNINSSLGFMEIAGKQSLNMQMEYYIRVPLKMVTSIGFKKLFGKKQEEVDPSQVDAIEYRDKDKRVHFINLKISGTPDAYKVGLGKAKRDLAAATASGT
ncbi:MAG TPA: AsmA family protein [Puia sp.]|uniref:AsmA family protein n=1 Tax=Puia sp. TaxID=2045100 RepID=UPI002BE4E3A0|nr:AsmA family protein [Puia sp.]HVU96279.1 AsmA family protein [Puia sp.]